MTPKPFLESHRREMSRRMPVYDLFEPFERAGFPGEILAALRREASALAELALAEALTVDSGVQQTAETIAGLGIPGAATTLKAWREAVAAAHISRPGMRLLFSGVGNWVRTCNPALLPAFFESLPRLAPIAAELGSKGFEQILANASELTDPEDSRRLLTAVAAYGATRGSIALGISRLARSLLERGRQREIERIETTVPPNRTYESRDAARLIPALADLSDACAALGNEASNRTLELTLEVAGRNLSSAYALARGLPGRLRRLPRETALFYLDDFHHGLQAVGIRLVGFGLNQLPDFYGRYGIERTRSFMEKLAAVAEAYGPTAGQWFFERRTTAAREILPR